MRPLLALLLFCFCVSVAFGQTADQKKKIATAKKTAATAKKTTTTAKKTGATVRKAVTKPSPATVVAATTTTEPAPSTLTFPSTEPDSVNTLDATQKQQMYDELHGVKPRNTTPETGRRGRNRSRDTDESATRADRREASLGGSEAKSYIGVRVGGNYTNYLQRLTVADGLGGVLDLTPDAYFGFHAGVVFQFGRGGVAFQPEINFNQDYFRGIDFNGNRVTQSVNSLVVPLLAKFQFGQQGNTRLFVNIGPYGSYSLTQISVNSETFIGYGGALGLGVGIPMGSGKFTVEARGYYPLGTTARGSEFGNVPGKPLLGQLSVGYLFPLGGR